jgi:hypothetical protein
VAAYSSIRLGSGRGQLNFATTLGIHNTSQDRPLVLLRADYFDTSGTLIHRYVTDPIAIKPLGSVEAFVPVEDTRGGTGANFVVEWAAGGPVSEPLVEAVMIGSLGTQGYSLVSRGKPVEAGGSPSETGRIADARGIRNRCAGRKPGASDLEGGRGGARAGTAGLLSQADSCG